MNVNRFAGSTVKSPAPAAAGMSSVSTAIASADVIAMWPAASVANPIRIGCPRGPVSGAGQAKSLNFPSCLPSGSTTAWRSVLPLLPQATSTRLPLLAIDSEPEKISRESSVTGADGVPAALIVEICTRFESSHARKNVFPLHAATGADCDGDAVVAGAAPEERTNPSPFTTAKRTTEAGTDCHVTSHSLPLKSADGATPGGSDNVAISEPLTSSMIVIRIFDSGPSVHRIAVLPAP